MAEDYSTGKDTVNGEHEMSFLDHLEELRWRIIKALVGIVIGAVVCGIFIDWIMNKLLLAPALATNPPLQLINLKPYGQLVLYMEVILVGGVVLSIPNVFYQLWKFVAPGLYKREKKVVFSYESPSEIYACQRLANGNTLVEWGCAVPTSGTIVTEVSPARQVVFEMQHRQTGGITSSLLGGGLTKQVWNSPDLVLATNYSGIVAGQTYGSAQAGVWASTVRLTGAEDNALTMERHLDAVRRVNTGAGKVP